MIYRHLYLYFRASKNAYVTFEYTASVSIGQMRLAASLHAIGAINTHVY